MYIRSGVAAVDPIYRPRYNMFAVVTAVQQIVRGPFIILYIGRNRVCRDSGAVVRVGVGRRTFFFL